MYNNTAREVRHSKQDSGRVDAGISSVRALHCDSRLPTEPVIHNNRGVVGLKVSCVDHQANVEPETELLKFVEKVNAQQMVQQINRMLKKARESINPKFVREWSDRNFLLW